MRTKKLWSRVISILLVVALLPVSALAEHTADPKVVTQPDFTVTVSHVNPEYERLGVKFTKPSADCMTMAETTVDSLDEAADYLREQMEDRVTEVTIVVQNHTYVSNQGLSDDWRTILYGAFEHTGVSTQGDYIIRHYGQANGQIGHNGISTATFKYTITYDTTLEQENEVGDKIDELFTAWDEVYNFYDLSDYEQIEMIYDYICANVVYDYDNLNDNSYTLKYSAYAALIQGTAVCQGYANLFYRMALEAGVDNRIIVGDAGGAHAWNIVDMGEKYYYLDSTWDAPRFDYGYEYFLLGSDNFHVDHTPDAEFLTEEFLAEYPIDAKDFDHDLWLILQATKEDLLTYFENAELNSGLTRLEMAKLIAAMVKLELDPNATLAYEDCAALTEQEKQIIAAVEKFGVMTAYKDGTFRPAETIDRARTALILYRAMNGNVDAEDIGDYADDGYFTDVSSILWYAPYVNYLASIGVIPAWADKTFDPDDTVLFGDVLRWMVKADSLTYSVVAEGSCGDNLTWVLTDDGVLTISGTGEMDNYELGRQDPWGNYTGEITSVVIEEGVTSIGDCAFAGFYLAESVTIPNSVEYIGTYALAFLSRLETLEIPASVTTIGLYAVSGCTKLTDIMVDESNKNYCSVDGVLFSEDKTLLITYPTGKDREEYVIPDGVVTIGEAAFSENWSIKSVFVPEGVTAIESKAFSCCTALESVILPEGLTSIGTVSFYKCDKLVSITLPDSLTTLGGEAFWECSALTSIVIPENVDKIEYFTFYNCTSLGSVRIPAKVSDIGAGAFSGCSKLATVYYTGTEEQWKAVVVGEYNDPLLNAKVVYGTDTPDIPGIPADALAYGTCGEDMYWYVTADYTLYILGEGEMADFEPVTKPWYDYSWQVLKAVVGDGVTTIGANAFSNFELLAEIELPDTLVSIGEYAFGGCALITSIDLPDSLTTIGIEAFADSGLTSIKLGDNVTSIGRGAFGACTSLKKVTLPAGLKTIENALFSGCRALVSVEIPASVTSIGFGAFEYCTSLAAVTIPAGVTSIGTYAFSNCETLKSVEIPNGVTTISESMFESCAALASITIPVSVSEIEWYAFSGCTALKTVNYGGTEAQWNAITIGVENDPLLSAAFVYGTEGGDGEHTHVYDESVWKNDETNHWHECTCGEKSGLAAHELEEVARWQNCMEPGGVIWHCTVCGYEYMEELPQLEHTPVTISGYPATCTEPGMTDGVECEVCGTVIEWPEEIPAKGHTDENGDGVCDECGEGEHTHVYDESVWKNDETNHWHECTCGEKSGLAAHELEEVARWQNCMEPGGVIWHCTVCGYEYMEELPQLEHTPVTVSGYPATCTEPGMTDGVECEVCGTVIEWPEEIPALGHEYDEGVVTTEPTCTENGVLTYTCQREGCDHSYTEVVKAKGHTDEDNDYICDDCDEELCTEHTEEVVPGKAATCTEPGLTEGKKCATCGKVLEEQEEIPALGHDYDDGVVTTEPTCTEDGVKTYTCEREGCDHSYTEVVKAKGHTDEDNDYICDDCDEELCTEHTEEVVPGKAATCTEPGLTEGKKCATCGKVLEEQEEIPALGHDYDDGVVTTEPTLTEAGIKTYTCEREGCGHSYTEEIAVLEFIEGTCGENVTWKLTKDGVLTISGEGAMYSFTFTAGLVPTSVLPMGGEKSETAPWNEYNGLIIKVIIEDGVTGIGDNAFAACENLKEIEISGTVTSIGDGAFTGCEALETVTYTGSEEQWAEIEIGAGNEVMEDIEITIADIIPGDVNGDGSVNIFDAIELLDLIADGSADALSSGEFRAADVNGDSSVNIFDAIELLDLIASGTV